MASGSSATARFNAQRVRQQLQHQEDALRLGTDMAQADPDVLFRQARRYHQGDGIPANYAQALLLYQLAAAKSSGPAQRMLNLIYSRPNVLGGVDISWMQQLAEADVSGPQVRWPRTRTSRTLARDPTALFDYLPDLWQLQP
jgi:TPR repeat protein